ncbi:BON domain-containing protein [Nostoc sp. NIES-2111]
MKKLFSLLVAGFLVVGSFGCQEAPSSNNGSTPAPAKEAAEGRTTVKETTTPVLGEKAKSKIETNKTAATKTEGDLKAAVSKKLQVGIPGNKLVVENKQGEITLKGVAKSQQEIEKAEKLIKDVKGVKSVKVEAKVEPANRS